MPFFEPPFSNSTPLNLTLYSRAQAILTATIASFIESLDRRHALAERFERLLWRFRAWSALLTSAWHALRVTGSRPQLPEALIPRAAVVLAWASFLLAPGTAHADAGSVAGGISSIEAAVLTLVGGVSLLALFKLAAPYIVKLANVAVDKGEAIVESDVDANPWLKTHPADTAAINGALRVIAGLVKGAITKAGADLSTAKALDAALLKQILADVKAQFLATVNVGTLTTILRNAGILGEGASLWDWAEAEASSILHDLAARQQGLAAAALNAASSALAAGAKTPPTPTAS